MKTELEYHPILLRDSYLHYDAGKKNNIIEFEQKSTIEGALGAIDYNTIKYTNREKGQNELDAKKIATFEAWRELLKDLLEMGYSKEHNLRHAMLVEYPNMKYSLDPSFQPVEKAKRLKPLLGTFGFNTLLTECEREEWKVPSFADIKDKNFSDRKGNKIKYDSCWVSDLPEDENDHETHAMQYFSKTESLVLVNKNNIGSCVVLACAK